MDILIPSWVKSAGVSLRYLDSTGVSQSDFGGPPRTASLGGDRLGASLQFTPTATSATDSAMERRRVMAIQMALRGRQGRLWMANPARRLGGTFPASELLTNPSWADGLTGWTTSGSEAVLSLADRRLRSTRAAGITARSIRNGTSFGVTQYVPYIVRALAIQGRGPIDTALRLGTTNGNNDIFSQVHSSAGLLTGVAVPVATGSAYFSLLDGANSRPAGDYQLFDYVSVSRGALVDTGVNVLTYSSDLSNSIWTKNNVSISATSVTLPDGTTGTVNSIKEDSTAGSQHRLQQVYTCPSAAHDLTFSAAFKLTVNRSWVALRMFEATGSTLATANFNTNGPSLGTVEAGANWANPRASMRAIGDGWYRCSITAQKTNSATSIEARIYVCEADNDFIFDGGNQDSIRVWLPTLAPTSVPTRLISTSALSLPTGTAPTGTLLYLCGLPASTSDLLLPGDEIEVISSYGSEYKFVTDTLSSDDGGLGTLHISPPIRGVVSNGAAVVVSEPLGYWMPTDVLGFDHAPGVLTQASIELQEAA
jgi:hypothetical protein